METQLPPRLCHRQDSYAVRAARIRQVLQQVSGERAPVRPAGRGELVGCEHHARAVDSIVGDEQRNLPANAVPEELRAVQPHPQAPLVRAPYGRPGTSDERLLQHRKGDS